MHKSSVLELDLLKWKIFVMYCLSYGPLLCTWLYVYVCALSRHDKYRLGPNASPPFAYGVSVCDMTHTRVI